MAAVEIPLYYLMYVIYACSSSYHGISVTVDDKQCYA